MMDSVPHPPFRKERKADPDEHVELELRKIEISDTMAYIQNVMFLIVGGWGFGLYLFLIEQLPSYEVCHPTSFWSLSPGCYIEPTLGGCTCSDPSSTAQYSVSL